MTCLVLQVDFHDPHRFVDSRTVIRGQDGLPFRLSQTWNRMADDILRLLHESIRLGYTPGGTRPLEPGEIRAFECVLAPLAEIGTALPSDPFPQRLWLSLDVNNRRRSDQCFASFAQMVTAWGDEVNADALEAYVGTRLNRVWRDAFSRPPSSQVETWVFQFAYLLVRPDDVHTLIDEPLRLEAS